MEEHLEDLLKKLSELNLEVSVAFIDIDNFKIINDTHGHVAGDELLKALGEEINSHIRKSDYAFRYGGDEFLLIFPNTKAEVALDVAKRIKENIFNFSEKKGIILTLSIGMTMHKKYESYKTLLNKVDQVMYQSKRNGKNQITLILS